MALRWTLRVGWTRLRERNSIRLRQADFYWRCSILSKACASPARAGFMYMVFSVFGLLARELASIYRSCPGAVGF
jgi:hypothetical protein